MVIRKVLRRVAAQFLDISGWRIAAYSFGLILLTELVYYLLGETQISDPAHFFYWIVEVGSTVGFGSTDINTTAGKLFTAYWTIPYTISLAAILLTKLGVTVADILHRQKRGRWMLDLQNHIVVIGWNDKRTIHLLELLFCEANGDMPDIVLVVNQEMDKPESEVLNRSNFHFVQAERYTDEATMARACLPKAKSILIDIECDNETLTTALYCNKVSPHSRKSAYFKDDAIAELAKDQCNLTCTPSISVEMLAKASTDPGSERLIRQLLDTRYGQNQFGVTVEDSSTVRYGSLFQRFKEQYDATIIGVRWKGEEKITLNASMQDVVSTGDTVYYIAKSRIKTPSFKA